MKIVHLVVDTFQDRFYVYVSKRETDMTGETFNDKLRYHVQEQFPDGLWYGMKLFAQIENAKAFAATVTERPVRIMTLLP